MVAEVATPSPTSDRTQCSRGHSPPATAEADGEQCPEQKKP